MLALRVTSPFRGFQCLSVCMWKSIGELGASEWQMETALWPLEIGKPFCPLLIECLTTGRSPHVKQPGFMLSQAAPTWPTCCDGNVRSWQPCHLQLALMPLRLDEWHFYESSQNLTGTGLNEDMNAYIRGITAGVNKITFTSYFNQPLTKYSGCLNIT